MPDISHIIAQIEQAVQEATGAYDVALTPQTVATDIPGWDSLAHMNIIIDLEQRLAIRFTTAELGALKDRYQTVGSLAETIAKKAAA